MHAIMDTVTKSKSLAKDRLTQTLAALTQLLDQTMNEVQNIDSEFQERIREAIRETEALGQQQAAERLKSATEETEQITRELVTQELEARFKQEIAAAVKAVRNEQTDDQVQVSERLRQQASEWEAERAKLVSDYQRANELLEQTREDHDRSLAETDEAASIALERQIATAVERVRAEAAIRWDSERAKLLAERDRAVEALAEGTAQSRKAIEEAERSAAEELKRKTREWESERDLLISEKQEIQELLAESTDLEQGEHSAEGTQAGQIEQSSVDLKSIRAELFRVEGLIQEISAIIEDPNTVLSLVIRKNAERAELESYLKGLRFVVAGK
jgi:hypothetical protein